MINEEQEAYRGLLEEKDNQKTIRKKNLEYTPKNNGYLIEHKDTGNIITPILVTEVEEVSAEGVRKKGLVDFNKDEEDK